MGVEQAALSATRQCGLEDKLSALGLTRPQIAAAVGNIVARMAQPCSELATHAWLKDASALGELIDFDFEAMDLNLWRSSEFPSRGGGKQAATRLPPHRPHRAELPQWVPQVRLTLPTQERVIRGTASG